MRVNFKNSLLTVARHLEGLFLRHAAMLGETLGPYRRRHRLVPAQNAPEPLLPAALAQADRQVETGKAGEGHGVGMTRQPMRRARKTPLSGNASLSEWRFPLSECHWPSRPPSGIRLKQML